jgi:hypothetical protein
MFVVTLMLKSFLQISFGNQPETVELKKFFVIFVL